MGQGQVSTNEQIIANQRFTLLELLDRLLDKGVVIKGEVLLSVADIDLAYLNLGLLLSSVKAVTQASRKGKKAGTAELPLLSPESFPDELLPASPRQLDVPETSSTAVQDYPNHDDGATSLTVSAQQSEAARFSGPRASIDPHNVEKGLAQLVLTLIELLRQLMERLAIRRIDADQLSDDEIESVGNAFFLLNERMEQLKDIFGLQDEDLNLDLGPLGELL